MLVKFFIKYYAPNNNQTIIHTNNAVKTKDSTITKATILLENKISFSAGFLAKPNKKHPKIIPVANAAKAIGIIAKLNVNIFAAIIINIYKIIILKRLFVMYFFLYYVMN